MTITGAIQLINSNRLKGTGPQQWADLGSGNGIFSKALLRLLPADSSIYALDKRPTIFQEKQIKFVQQDFENDPLSLPPLHGLIMANALHFVQNKILLLQKVRNCLLPGGIFVLVEYNTDVANRYVPYPISFDSAVTLFKEAGFGMLEKISEYPSVYQRAGMYGAQGIKRVEWLSG